eukprot:gnl/Hemi2/19113_TR6339_c0_g3_i1.p1 gnl/Hemi2/19113_TR6339_c0_g3~~gnl/Hemi2/19113_TR6339_c0_g3_i1.p1  ORF type:complete len:255 (-),score=48.02 gnl/Hemi2/19113_TR6339_c0_g3_i1:72-836(-)
MFRNQYDTDVITWSPQGRIHQIEYALEAVKQGSATLGARSKTHVVLTGLKRASDELGIHQKKLFPIDHHMGIAISGLIADARHLAKYMRTECLNHRFTFDSSMQINRMAQLLGDKAQARTQFSSKRPLGVGLLVGGYDETGPHLFEVSPAGTYYEYEAISIGARSQTAKTYLQKHYESFRDLPVEKLAHHCLVALRETIAQPGTLTAKNCSLAIAGPDGFKMIDGADMQPYIDRLYAEDMPAHGTGESAAPMEQ